MVHDLWLILQAFCLGVAVTVLAHELGERWRRRQAAREKQT